MPAAQKKAASESGSARWPAIAEGADAAPGGPRANRFRRAKVYPPRWALAADETTVTRHGPGPDLGALLEDVLSAPSCDPELVIRYERDPGSLTVEERAEVEAWLGETPHRDALSACTACGQRGKLSHSFDFRRRNWR